MKRQRYFIHTAFVFWLLGVAGLIGWTSHTVEYWHIERLSNWPWFSPQIANSRKHAPDQTPVADLDPIRDKASLDPLLRETPPVGLHAPRTSAFNLTSSSYPKSAPTAALTPNPIPSPHPPQETIYPFYLVEAVSRDTGIVFQRRGAHGQEWSRGQSGEWRRHVPSYHQVDFPEPESGCGPVAILNWLTWYQDIGMLTKNIDQPGTDIRARYNHRLIEQEIVSMRNRAPGSRGGTTSLEIISAFDRIVNRLSNRQIRLGYEVHEVPLSIDDLNRFTRGFRSAILLVRPVNPETGQLESLHAVSVIAGDRAGYVMLNNWGQKLHGALRNEPDGQFFSPSTADSPRLKLEQLICLVPFTPDDPTAFTLFDLPKKTLHHREPLHARHQNNHKPPSPKALTASIPPTSEIAFTTIPSGTASVRNRYRISVSNHFNRPVVLHLQNIKGLFSNGREYFPTSILHEKTDSTHKTPRHGSNKGLYLAPGDQQTYLIEFNRLELHQSTLTQLRWAGL